MNDATTNNEAKSDETTASETDEAVAVSELDEDVADTETSEDTSDPEAIEGETASAESANKELSFPYVSLVSVLVVGVLVAAGLLWRLGSMTTQYEQQVKALNNVKRNISNLLFILSLRFFMNNSG